MTCCYRSTQATHGHHLNTSRHRHDFELSPADNQRLAELCGELDHHLRLIEEQLGVEINHRGHRFQVIGSPPSANRARKLLEALYEKAAHAVVPINAEFIYQWIAMGTPSNESEKLPDYHSLTLHTRQVKITPRTPNQFHYVKHIQSHDINFGVGPSGTGKTYLAVACAAHALTEEQVKRIILVRPAVEAGEKLGFLPGDLAEKVDPYLRPLYDALYDMLGIEHVDKLIEKNVIEVAPLAYMRGRTLNDAFIILDESQNTTREQMKMFLTRMGFGSKVVITGDITQVDLPKPELSGLRHAIDLLSDIKGVHFTFFHSKDILRHPLVQCIIEAYERSSR